VAAVTEFYHDSEALVRLHFGICAGIGRIGIP
jgi:hypothetical protein